MKRKCVITRSFSMFLLTFLLSITIAACSSAKDDQLQETEKTAIKQDTTEKVEQTELPVESVTVGGLDFDCTPDDVANKLGKPSKIESAKEVSVYYYEDGSHSENTIYFIEDKVCGIIIAKDDLTAPKGIKVGDSIVDALKKYYIPDELVKLGVSKDSTDEEILQKIDSRGNTTLFFNDYETARIKLVFDPPSGIIKRIGIIKANDKYGSVRLDPSDFSADAEEIAAKFGYPDDLIIYDEYGYEFEYSDLSARIMLLGDSSVGGNYFYCSDQWTMPYDIKVGDEIRDVFEKVYISDEIADLGITLSLDNREITKILTEQHMSNLSFDMLPDYNIGIGVDKSGIVYYAYVSKFENHDYQIVKSNSAYTVPVFDKEAIAAKADLYMSGCKFGSTRQEVFQLLGSPEKTEAGYGELRKKYQDCYFGSSFVNFLEIDNYEDLTSGKAWKYYTEDPSVTGPRGMRVGDNIERVLEVFPGRDDIDFRTITNETAIYTTQDSPDENTATVYPTAYKTNAGEVNINVDWVYEIIFKYEDGIITGMSLNQMLD